MGCLFSVWVCQRLLCIRVYLDWINIFCSSLSRRRFTLTISKQRARICDAFRTGVKDNISTVAAGNLPCCVCFFLRSLWFCWLGEALLTTHLLCLCHQLTWLTSAAITCSIKAWSPHCSLPVCGWSLVVTVCMVPENFMCFCPLLLG